MLFGSSVMQTPLYRARVYTVHSNEAKEFIGTEGRIEVSLDMYVRAGRREFVANRAQVQLAFNAYVAKNNLSLSFQNYWRYKKDQEDSRLGMPTGSDRTDHDNFTLSYRGLVQFLYTEFSLKLLCCDAMDGHVWICSSCTRNNFRVESCATCDAPRPEPVEAADIGALVSHSSLDDLSVPSLKSASSASSSSSASAAFSSTFSSSASSSATTGQREVAVRALLNE